MSNQKTKIRTMVANIYDVQKLRIQTGNRLVASFTDAAEKSRTRTAESVKAGLEETKNTAHAEIEKKLKKKNPELTGAELKAAIDEELAKQVQKESDNTIKKIMDEYTRITDLIATEVRMNPRTSHIEKAIAGSENLEFIGDVYDYQMANTYASLIKTEENATKALSKEVEKHPMWDAFFKDVPGCGPMMAAVCIAYLDPYRARHRSSFYRYAGLDVVIDADGKGRGKGRWHTVEQEYIDKNGDVQIKKGLGYNPFLKTKLIGVLGSGMMKAGIRRDKETNEVITKGIYAKAYVDYKFRLDQREDTKDYSKAHKHNMAVRYMVKIFLSNMWETWRKLEGLEVSDPYEVAFLGRNPHGYNDANDKCHATAE